MVDRGLRTRDQTFPLLTSRYLVAALISCAPFFSGMHAYVGFALKPFMLVTLLCLPLLRGRTPIGPITLTEGLFLFYAASSAIATLYSTDRAASFRLLLGHLLLIGCYFLWKFCLRSLTSERLNKALNSAFRIGLVASAVACVVGVVQLPWPLYAVNNTIIAGVMIERLTPRMTGLVGDPNMLAFVLTPCFFFYFQRISRAPLWFLVSILVLVLTLSRGGTAGHVAGVFAFAMAARHGRHSATSGFAIAALVTTVIAAILATLHYFPEIFVPIIERRLSPGSVTSGRLELWGNGLRMLSEHPFGVGPHAFKTIHAAEFGVEKYAHNTYLEVLVEAGPLTLALYVAWQLSLLRMAWRLRATEPWLVGTTVAMQIQLFALSLLIHESLFLLMLLVHILGARKHHLVYSRGTF